MKTVRLWGPVVVWMAVIFFLSGRQSVQVSDQGVINFLFFKTLHVIEYAALFMLTYRAARNTWDSKNAVNPFVIAMILTILYAISDEVHQTFVPTREGKLRDVIIDALGAATAWISLKQLLPKAPKKLRVLGKRFLLL